MSDSLPSHRLDPTRLLCPWNAPDKNTGVGCHSFLQGLFPIQGLNPGLLHSRQILHYLSYQGSPYLADLEPVSFTGWPKTQRVLRSSVVGPATEQGAVGMGDGWPWTNLRGKPEADSHASGQGCHRSKHHC